MQIQYDGSHSVTFYSYRDVDLLRTLTDVTYNTWTSWHLIPVSAPFFKMYENQLSVVQIPGTNKIIDLSEAVAGKVLHGRRSGEWEFIMDTEGAGMRAIELYRNISELINGKWVLCALDDYEGEFYTGRVQISDFNISKQYATIKFKYDMGDVNTAWLATGDQIAAEAITGEELASMLMRTENISFAPITGEPFNIIYTTPPQLQYEIDVNDDGTLIAEDVINVDDIEDEYVMFDDNSDYDPLATHTVYFINDDGSILQQINVNAGESASYSGTTPVSPYYSNASFLGWSDDTSSVWYDTYTRALYDYADAAYTVTFYNDDGSVLQTSAVKYGDRPRYSSGTPKSAYDSEAVFVGWNKPFTDIYSVTRYYPVYNYTVTTYTVNFKNWSYEPHTNFYGDVVYVADYYVIETDIVPSGGYAIYKGDGPFSYYKDKLPFNPSFTGWTLGNVSQLNVTHDGYFIASYDYVTASTPPHIQYVRIQRDTDTRFIDGVLIESPLIDSQNHTNRNTNLGDYETGTFLNVIPLLDKINNRVSIGLKYFSDATVEYSYADGAYDYLLYSGIYGSDYCLAGFIFNDGWRSNDSEYLNGFAADNPLVYTGVYTYGDGIIIEDSWDDIIASVNDGTYVNKYHIGDIKEMTIVIPRREHSDVSSDTCVNTSVMMEIVAIDSGENNKITWMCVSGINPPVQCGFFKPGTSNDQARLRDDYSKTTINSYLNGSYAGVSGVINYFRGYELYNYGIPANVRRSIRKQSHSHTGLHTTYVGYTLSSNPQWYIDGWDDVVNTDTNCYIFIPSRADLGLREPDSTEYIVDLSSRFSTPNLRKKYFDYRIYNSEDAIEFKKWILSDMYMPSRIGPFSSTEEIEENFKSFPFYAIGEDGELTTVQFEDEDYIIPFMFSF